MTIPQTPSKENLPKEVEPLQEMFLSVHQRMLFYKADSEKMRRLHYGVSSEKNRLDKDPGHPLLFELPTPPEDAPQAEPVAPVGNQVPVVDAPQKDAPQKPKPTGRKPLPAHLERRRVEITIPEDKRCCGECGEIMQKIGEEVSEQLDYDPALPFVWRRVRAKYGCVKNKCEVAPLLAEPAPSPIDKGLAGPGLLAHIAVSKFGDHLPLYRQENIFARNGIEIARSTQCAWLGQVADLCEPLWKRIIALVVASGKLHTDDTPVEVLAPGEGKTHTSRLWVYVGDDAHPFTAFDYTRTRGAQGPSDILARFKGYLQADAYTVYDRINKREGVLEVGCWAHVRRKFLDSISTDSRAKRIVELIGEMYAVEKKARVKIDKARARPVEQREAALASAFAERKSLRDATTSPLLKRIGNWLEEKKKTTLPKSPMGEAITYAQNQWAALKRFVDDGELEIDNNIAENAIRPIAIGRKNYLFVGSDEGGRRAAIIYTMIRSCERHGVNPFDYLRDVLMRVSTHFASDIDALLPHRWTPAK